MEAGTLARGGRSAPLERPLRARLPDRVLEWTLTGLAAGVLILIGYFFVRLYGEASPVFKHVRRPRLRLQQRVGAVAGPVRRAAAGRGDADHVGDRADPRRAGGRRRRRSTSPSSRPRGVKQPLTILVELLAAVPSVVYGLWGVFVLIPKLKPVEQWFSDTFAFLPFVGGDVAGPNYFIAGLILAIMILPIVSAISREVMATVPVEHKEAALALGATRWEMIRMAVLPVLARRHHRRRDARPRPRDRRDDRRDAGDRQRGRRSGRRSSPRATRSPP